MRHCQESKAQDKIWRARPGEIAEFCYSLPPGVIPGSENTPNPSRKQA
jgi:hypothetical protein